MSRDKRNFFDFLFLSIFFYSADFTHVPPADGKTNGSHAERIVNDMKDKYKYVITGALAGGANGFFGSGGGLFLVPLFTKWLKMEQRKAFATSVAVILPLSLVSAIVYLFKGQIDLGMAWPYLLGGLAGGIVSGRIFGKIPVTLLRRAFGLLIIYGGIRAVLLL